MDQVREEESKSRLLKTLAVIGFVVIVVFGTWLAIQTVSHIPGAFSSLANLAESVQQGQQQQSTITLSGHDSVVNAQESFAVEWTDVQRNGVYTIWYSCVDGVSLDIRVDSDEIIQVPCDTSFILPEDTLSIDASFASAKKRFVDVPYSIGFIKDGESDTFIETSKTLTIVNANIPQAIVLGEETTVEEVEEIVVETEPVPEVAEPTPTPTTPTTPTVPPAPRYIYTTTYEVPTSNPNGFTDLQVKYVSVGTLTNNNTFIQKGSLDVDDRGAFQFEVKNIGTKTSTSWDFEATLMSGAIYDSKTQAPLKPNESAFITIAFGDVGKEGTRSFGAEIDGGSDRNSKNNDFTWAITVTD